ncbi:MAG: hypothetical protein Q8Q80_05560 [Methyloversatilis sp.]|uniref:hypothetical protein n=1 Tax=Methyloversatilis sp. TaxID=2569862 RepID=UPI00273360F4|nr:hypothetical protein [Methyloversatilis sp.]MDP3872109.1 hypothetical protein [Methyloversatilis sp.]
MHPELQRKAGGGGRALGIAALTPTYGVLIDGPFDYDGRFTSDRIADRTSRNAGQNRCGRAQ